MYHLVKSRNWMTTQLIYKLIEESLIESGKEFHLHSNFKELKKIRNTDRFDIFVVGDLFDAFKLILKKRRVVMWFQGVLPEENYMVKQSRLKKYILDLIEKFVYRKSYYKLIVSRELFRHFQLKYNKKNKYDDNHFLLPCFSEKEIQNDSFMMENKYKSNIFVYAGSLHKWQQFEYTIKLYKEIEKKSLINCSILILTPSIKEAELIAQKYGLVNYEIKFVKQNQLNIQLRPVKFGFIIRENSIVNNVSTPTKLSTYISNGIIPIYTSSIKEFSRIASSTENKIELQDINLNDNSSKILEYMNKKIENQTVYDEYKSLYETYYNFNRYKESLSRILVSLIGESDG